MFLLLITLNNLTNIIIYLKQRSEIPKQRIQNQSYFSLFEFLQVNSMFTSIMYSYLECKGDERTKLEVFTNAPHIIFWSDKDQVLPLLHTQFIQYNYRPRSKSSKNIIR